MKNFPHLTSMSGFHYHWHSSVCLCERVLTIVYFYVYVGIIMGIYLLAKHEDKTQFQRPLVDNIARFNYGTLVPASPAASSCSIVEAVDSSDMHPLIT